MKFSTVKERYEVPELRLERDSQPARKNQREGISYYWKSHFPTFPWVSSHTLPQAVVDIAEEQSAKSELTTKEGLMIEREAGTPEARTDGWAIGQPTGQLLDWCDRYLLTDDRQKSGKLLYLKLKEGNRVLSQPALSIRARRKCWSLPHIKEWLSSLSGCWSNWPCPMS